MKPALMIFLLSFVSLAAQASWYFNQNGGIGIYQPEGWSLRENGRSALLSGPVDTGGRSQIFFGSDWISGIKSPMDLLSYLHQQESKQSWQSLQVGSLKGYGWGDDQKGELYILRDAENIIVIRYDLRGSADQMEEGRQALSSIDIRTGGYEN